MSDTGADTEKKMATLVKALGGKSRKVVSPGTKGTADQLVAFIASGPFFVEVKMSKETIKLRQRKEAREWLAQGVPCYAVRSTKAALWLIRAAHRGALPRPGVYL